MIYVGDIMSTSRDIMVYVMELMDKGLSLT